MVFKNNWSVFHYWRRPRYYLLRPWKFIQETYYNLKYAWQRAVRGYADTDVFDFFEWFLYVIPPMLNDLADDHGGYPGIAPFTTPELWTSWLHEQAQNLISCREEEQEKRNEYYNDWLQSFEMTISKKQNTFTFSDNDEISQLYLNRDKELYEESRQTLRATFAALAEWFYALWS